MTCGSSISHSPEPTCTPSGVGSRGRAGQDPAAAGQVRLPARQEDKAVELILEQLSSSRRTGSGECTILTVVHPPAGRDLAPPSDPPHYAVGLLTHVDSTYRFCYLRSAGTVEGFQPFLGFPDLERRYAATALFPLFPQRVMRPRRPDFDRYRRALSLDVDSSDWAMLGRSQGQREGDGIRVFPEPDVDEAGATSSTFFVSGLGDRMREDPRVEPALVRLGCREPPAAAG